MDVVSRELQIFLIICSAIFFIIIFNSGIKKKMDIRYFTLWITLAIIFIVLSIFPNLTIYISDIVKIKEPVHFVFLIVIAFLLLIVFIYNYTIAKLINKNRILIQEIGIVKKRIDDIEKRNKE